MTLHVLDPEAEKKLEIAHSVQLRLPPGNSETVFDCAKGNWMNANFRPDKGAKGGKRPAKKSSKSARKSKGGGGGSDGQWLSTSPCSSFSDVNSWLCVRRGRRNRVGLPRASELRWRHHDGVLGQDPRGQLAGGLPTGPVLPRRRQPDDVRLRPARPGSTSVLGCGHSCLCCAQQIIAGANTNMGSAYVNSQFMETDMSEWFHVAVTYNADGKV